MLSIEQAQAIIFEESAPLPACNSSLVDCLDRVLAEDIASDVDSPPHNKSIVDGYAVRADDANRNDDQKPFVVRIVEEVTAGKVPQETLESGMATRIMTGAPIPPGADAVVKVEETETLEAQKVRIDSFPIEPGMNIMRQGASMRRGDVVLGRGTILRPIEIGLLAEIGRSSVPTIGIPRVSILSTGNELVPVEKTPSEGKIRNSNGSMLTAAVQRAGACPVPLGIAPDTSELLHRQISEGLGADVLLISGGVSVGVLDLVPKALRSLGVEQRFHKVRVKPGKPLWFGVFAEAGKRCLVFGLPGNPLSGFVSFELFVAPCLAALAGRKAVPPKTVSATLSGEYSHRGARPSYCPAILRQEGERREVKLAAWQGSSDMRGFAAGNALAIFPAGDRTHRTGETIDVLPLSLWSS